MQLKILAQSGSVAKSIILDWLEKMYDVLCLLKVLKIHILFSHAVSSNHQVEDPAFHCAGSTITPTLNEPATCERGPKDQFY